MSMSTTQPASPASTTAGEYNLPPYWDTLWANFKSNWTFPPPVDTKLLQEYRYSKYFNGSTTYLSWAAQNFTRPSEGNFAASRAIVMIGDIIEVDWIKAKAESTENAEPRIVKMYCAICPEGPNSGSIFNACSNYTENISTFSNQTASISPHEPLVLQRLSSTLDFSHDAVGICYLSLSALDGTDTYDNTFPFPVSNSRTVPSKRFSLRYPTGNPELSIITRPTPVSTSPAAQGSKDKPSVGIIAGVAIAVFVFTCLVVAIIWFVWTRTKRARAVKRVDTPGTDDEVEMQRVQNGGVQRRMDRDDDGEAPPAYHESLKHEIVTDHEQRRVA